VESIAALIVAGAVGAVPPVVVADASPKPPPLPLDVVVGHGRAAGRKSGAVVNGDVGSVRTRVVAGLLFDGRPPAAQITGDCPPGVAALGADCRQENVADHNGPHAFGPGRAKIDPSGGLIYPTKGNLSRGAGKGKLLAFPTVRECARKFLEL